MNQPDEREIPWLREMVDSPGWKVFSRMAAEEIEERRRQNADELEDLEAIKANRKINLATRALLERPITRAYPPEEKTLIG